MLVSLLLRLMVIISATRLPVLLSACLVWSQEGLHLGSGKCAGGGVWEGEEWTPWLWVPL